MTEMERILTAIERECADDFSEELDMLAAFYPEELSQRELECQKRLSAIYKIAHAFNTMHSCYHVHDDWRRETAGEDAMMAERGRK